MKKRFSHNATIQQKLVLTLLLSILTPMIIFGSIFRIYSRREFNAQTLSSIRTGFQSSINSFQDQLQLITYVLITLKPVMNGALCLSITGFYVTAQ